MAEALEKARKIARSYFGLGCAAVMEDMINAVLDAREMDALHEAMCGPIDEAHTPKEDERVQRLLAQAQTDAAKFLDRAEKAEAEVARLRKAMKEAIKSIGMASDLIETNRSNLVKDPRNNVVAPDVELIWRGLCELADEIGRLTAALSPEATKGGDPDTAPEPETARAHIAQPAREDDPVSATEQWFAVLRAGEDLGVRPRAYPSREACRAEQGGHPGYYLGAIERSWLGAAPAIDIGKVPDGIYIASKAKHGQHWQTYRSQGFPIISTWIDESGEGQTTDFHDLWHRCATEAASAAVTIVYHEDGETPKGALLEAGAALSHGRRIIVVGNPPGTWVRHRNVTRAPTIESALNEALSLLPKTQGDGHG